MNQYIKTRLFPLAIVFCIVLQILAPMGVVRVKASEQEADYSHYEIPEPFIVVDLNDGNVTINGTSVVQNGITTNYSSDNHSIVIQNSGNEFRDITLSNNVNYNTKIYLDNLNLNRINVNNSYVDLYIIGKISKTNNTQGLFYFTAGSYGSPFYLNGFDNNSLIEANTLFEYNNVTSNNIPVSSLKFESIEIAVNNIGSLSTSSTFRPSLTIKKSKILSNKESIFPTGDLTVSISDSFIKNGSFNIYSSNVPPETTITNSKFENVTFQTRFSSLYFDNCQGDIRIFENTKVRSLSSNITVKSDYNVTLKDIVNSTLTINRATNSIAATLVNNSSINVSGYQLARAGKLTNSAGKEVFFNCFLFEQYKNTGLKIRFDNSIPVILYTDSYGGLYPYLPEGSSKMSVTVLDEDNNETDIKFDVNYGPTGNGDNADIITVGEGSPGSGIDPSVVEDLQNQISLLESQLARANADKSTLQNTILGLNEQIISLNQTITSLNNQVTALQEVNEGLEEDNEELLQQVAGLTQQLAQANNQISALQSQIANLIVEKEGLSNQIILLNDTIIVLSQQVETLELQLQGKEEENSSLKNNITLLNAKIQDLTEQINTFISDISDLEIHNALLTQQILDLTSENENLLLQISSLQAQLHTANIRIGELEEQVNQFILKQAQLEEEKETLLKNNQLLTDELVNAQNRILEVNALLNLIKEELGIEDEADILLEIIRLKSRLQEEINKNTNLQETIDLTISDLEAANEANRRLQEKLEELEELLANSDNEELLKKLLELQEELSASKNRVLELEGEKNLLQEQLNNSIQQVELLKEKVDELNAIIKENEKEFQDKLSELDKELDKLKEDNNSLEESILTLEKESGRIILENDALQTEISRLQKLLDLANDTNDELREKILEIMLENERLKKELEKQSNVYPVNPNNDEVINQLQKEIDALKEELNSKEKLPQNPNEVIVIIEKEQDVITTIIQNDLDQIQKEDKIKAKAGWEVAVTLDSRWKRDLDISEVIKSTDSTESSFFAREIDNPDKIYYITIHVLTRKDIPSLTMPKTVYMGSTYKLLLGNVQNGKITFTSDNTDIATVDDKGVVTPVSVGKVRITSEVLVDKDLYRFDAMIHVKDGGVTLNLRDGIVQAVGETPIITMYKLIRKNESVKLNVKGSNEATVKYITSNAEIVTIKENGVMTGHNKGEATVTALIMQDSKVYTYLIKVRIDDGTEDSSKWNYLER